MNIFRENPLKIYILQVAFLGALCGMSACNKEKIAAPSPPPSPSPPSPSVPPSNCKITSVTLLSSGGMPETVNFTYGEDGRLKFLNFGNQTEQYVYETNGFWRISNIVDGFYTHSFVALNASGLPITKKDTTFNGQDVTQTNLLSFEYNSQGELIKVVSDDTLQQEETLTWANGNLVKHQIGNTIYILDYYTDKLNMDFSLIDLQFSLAVGINPARSKNLLKSLTSDGNQLIFEYQFDAHGNIKAWKATLLGETAPSLRATQSIQCD